MIKNRLSLLILTSIFFAGCAMIPEYNRPQSPTPQAWPDEPACRGTGNNAEAVPATEMAWQSFFTDPRLQSLIRTALENNRDLRLAAVNSCPRQGQPEAVTSREFRLIFPVPVNPLSRKSTGWSWESPPGNRIFSDEFAVSSNGLWKNILPRPKHCAGRRSC